MPTKISVQTVQDVFGNGNLRPMYVLLKVLEYIKLNGQILSAVSCEKSMCQTSDYLRVTSAGGFLSSDVTQKSGCGSSSCPWVLEAQPGQQINISLLDFSRGKSFKTESLEPGKVKGFWF